MNYGKMTRIISKRYNLNASEARETTTSIVCDWRFLFANKKDQQPKNEEEFNEWLDKQEEMGQAA